MGERITMVLDDDSISAINHIRAQLLRKGIKPNSFSAVANDIIQKGLKAR